MGGGMQLETTSRTLVLIGRTGNGKSATGNTILQRVAFKSGRSFYGVTSTAEFHTGLSPNGEAVKIIDTPGLFDFKVGQEVISREIAKCVQLASNGIHAVLFVFSLNGRFTEEEASAIQCLQAFFGPKITDYIVVVFTGGDSLDNNESLRDRLACIPDPLKDILELCKNRCIALDNKTQDVAKKALQLQSLFSLVDAVIAENGGQPYNDNMLAEFKKADELQKQKEEPNVSKGHTEEEIAEMTEKIKKSYDEQHQKMMEMLETKLKETNLMLQNQLDEEKAARKKTEEQAAEDRKQAEAHNQQLREDVARSEQIARDAQVRVESKLEETNQMLQKQLAEEKAARKESEKQAAEDRKRVEDHNQRLRNDVSRAEQIARDAQNRCAIM